MSAPVIVPTSFGGFRINDEEGAALAYVQPTGGILMTGHASEAAHAVITEWLADHNRRTAESLAELINGGK